MSYVGERRGRVVITVKARPGARANKLVGLVNDELVVDVAEAPEQGKATRELCRFLAKILGLGRSEVEVLSGDAARHKVISLPLSARGRLEELVSGLPEPR